MDSDGSDEAHIVYGSSFVQNAPVFESRFLHCYVPLDIGPQLDLAEQLYHFYQNQEASNGIYSQEFLNRLRRLQVTYKAPSDHPPHPLQDISKRLLPFLQTPNPYRRPLADVYQVTPSPERVTPTATLPGEEVQDVASLFDALRLGDVPTEPVYNFSTTTAASVTNTNASSVLQSIASRLQERDAESIVEQPPRQGRGSQQTPRTSESRQSLSAQRSPVGRQEPVLRTTVRVHLQDDGPDGLSGGITSTGDGSELPVSHAGGARDVSTSSSPFRTSNLDRVDRRLGSLFSNPRGRQIPTNFPKRRRNLQTTNPFLSNARSKRSTFQRILSLNSSFELLATNVSIPWTGHSKCKSLQYGMADRAQSEARNTDTDREMGFRCIPFRAFRWCNKKMQSSQFSRDLQKLHTTDEMDRCRGSDQQHADSEGSSEALFNTGRKFCELGVRILLEQDECHSRKQFLSRSIHGRTHKFQEADCLSNICDTKCSKSFCEVYLKWLSPTRTIRHCQLFGYCPELPTSEVSWDRLFQLLQTSQDIHAQPPVLRNISISTRTKRSGENHLYANNSGDFIPFRRTGSQIIYGNDQLTHWKTEGSKTSLYSRPSVPRNGRKLQINISRDPLKITKQLQNLIIDLTKRTMKKKDLNPQMSLTSTLKEALTEVFIYQTLDRLMGALEQISQGKLAKYLPTTFLKQLTTQIQANITGTPYKPVNLTTMPQKELSKLPISIHKDLNGYHAILSVPLNKDRFASYSYDRKSNEILRKNNLYALTFNPKHDLLIKSPAQNLMHTIPNLDYLDKNCVYANYAYYCLKQFISNKYNGKDYCLTTLYRDQPSLEACNGQFKPSNVTPVEIAPNVYSVLAPKDTKVVQVCRQPLKDKVHAAHGRLNFTLSGSCPKAYVSSHSIQYHTPTVTCRPLPCRDFATNLFDFSSIQPYLNYVDNTLNTVDIDALNNSYSLYQYPSELLLSAAGGAAFLCLLILTLCVKHFRSKHHYRNVPMARQIPMGKYPQIET